MLPSPTASHWRIRIPNNNILALDVSRQRSVFINSFYAALFAARLCNSTARDKFQSSQALAITLSQTSWAMGFAPRAKAFVLKLILSCVPACARSRRYG